MAKVWEWIKKWGAALAGLLLLLLGAGWLWNRQQQRLGKLKDRLALVEAMKDIDTLRALRVEIEDRTEENTEAIETLDQKILESKRKIVEAHVGGEGLSDEEMLSEFERLGY
jgi:hypothetical protein